MAKTYHSFAGIDIQAVFEDVVFGELQMVSYKIDREKAPVYTMGSADLRTIARGKRLVTGACVFVVFDRDSLLETMKDRTKHPALPIEDTANLDAQTESLVFTAGTSFNGLEGTELTGAQLDSTGAGQLGASFKSVQTAKLADQLLAFDITLVGVNEYGATTKMIIHGVELMTEASGVSIDDLVIEKQFSFLARRVTNWTAGQAITGSAVQDLEKLGI